MAKGVQGPKDGSQLKDNKVRREVQGTYLQPAKRGMATIDDGTIQGSMRGRQTNGCKVGSLGAQRVCAIIRQGL